jgi:hypothetical protein
VSQLCLHKTFFIRLSQPLKESLSWVLHPLPESSSATSMPRDRFHHEMRTILTAKEFSTESVNRQDFQLRQIFLNSIIFLFVYLETGSCQERPPPSVQNLNLDRRVWASYPAQSRPLGFDTPQAAPTPPFAVSRGSCAFQGLTPRPCASSTVGG